MRAMSGGAGRAVPEGARATPVALDLPGTAAGLERYRASAVYWAGVGAAGVLVWVPLAVFFGGLFLNALPVVVGAGAGAMMTGGLVRSRSRRMRRILGAQRWTAHNSVALPRGMHGAAVVLGGPSAGELLPLRPFTTQSRFPLLNGPAGVLWWCGDARTGGVLAPPGGRELIWAGPVRGARARRIAARPQVDGLRHRPAPRRPQGTTDEGATGEGAYGSSAGEPGRRSSPSSSSLSVAAPGSASASGSASTPSCSSASASVGYEAVAALAETQAGRRAPATARPRPVGDVRAGRAVTWWRVPMLRRISGIGRASGLLGYTVAVAVVCATMGADSVPGTPRALAVLTGIVGAYWTWRTFTSGIPAARRTARAATAPEPRTRRYALLFDVGDAAEGPLLVIFPAEGADALPEGLARIVPPGPDKCPWAGLPAPTGTVELRGWLDAERVVVAWIEGRPYWPQDVYQDVDPSDPEALEAVAELLPGPM
ncbi:hypothetical protein [Streptomyces sp. NPDC088137]|uniref:hypothetical protein n=1 Tax=Streptomyces sp. NPDC088137 TaxID=3365827 RepID=UPI0038300A90